MLNVCTLQASPDKPVLVFNGSDGQERGPEHYMRQAAQQVSAYTTHMVHFVPQRAHHSHSGTACSATVCKRGGWLVWARRDGCLCGTA